MATNKEIYFVEIMSPPILLLSFMQSSILPFLFILSPSPLIRYTELAVLVQIEPANLAKRANPSYFTMSHVSTEANV